MPAFITLDAVTYRAPDGRNLFENLTLAFGRERTGLVGRNGVGKTSLLRLILGEARADARDGQRHRPRRRPAPDAAAGRPARRSPMSSALAKGWLAWRGSSAGRGRSGDLEAADWLLPQRIEEALEARSAWAGST